MKQLTALPQFTRNTKRFTQILTILGKYGFANWAGNNDPDFFKALLQRLVKADQQLTKDQRIRLALTELGPTFIKLGQILSTRPDLVGPGLADELTLLQSKTPPDSPEDVRATFEREIGKPPEEVFREFDEQPMASASIGQVHKAVLDDGTPVVVKVQHAGIEEVITKDLEILMVLAEMAEHYNPALRVYQPQATAAEFRRNLLRELDFERERRSLDLFAQNFARDETVHFPISYPEYSGRRVLTMEMLKGTSIDRQEKLLEQGIDTRQTTQQGANIFLEMVFRDRFFHADPHPGNIWVLESGKIGILDCGMVARIDNHTREDVEGMLLAALEKDADELTGFVLRIGTLPPDIDRKALSADIDEFVAEYLSQSLENFDLSGAVSGLMDIIRNYHIILPPSVSMLLKALVMLEGTSRKLDRSFNLMELMKPYYSRAMKRRFSPHRIKRRLQKLYQNWDQLFHTLPVDLRELIDRVRAGTFEVNLWHRHLDAMANRVIYGIISAALFLGSSQMLSAHIPPLYRDVSIPGSIGCLLSFILGIRLLRAVSRSGALGDKRE
ncbi:MAG: AarF/ABC1/UbiB kinase family protein [Acidobacteriota bacterium]|nr:AarF/ABC1/UbiB kinase family protein [Acidobacteriota bacterium]